MSLPKNVIFGVAGTPVTLDPETDYTNYPAAVARPIMTDNVGVPYVRAIIETPDGPGVLETVNWETTGLPIPGLRVVSMPLLFNGANTAYRQVAQSATNMSPDPTAPITGIPLTAGAPEWALTHLPAVGVRATITRAALAGIRHVCKGISATFCCAPADTATTGILHLRDGATGAGTILRSWRFAIFDTTNGGNMQVDIAGLNIVGSVNTAMTLEFQAAPGAASFQSVGISGSSAGD